MKKCFPLGFKYQMAKDRTDPKIYISDPSYLPANETTNCRADPKKYISDPSYLPANVPT